jgi:hypothetical protein
LPLAPTNYELRDYITFHTRKRLFAGSLETQGKQGKRVRHPKLQTRPLLVAERLSYEKNRTLETEGCGTQPPNRSGVSGGEAFA